MISPVVRLLLTIVVVIILLIGAAVLIGRSSPPEANRSVLASNPCSLPCLFGITPGQTTRAQAIAILKPYKPTQISDAVIIFPLLDHSGRMADASVSFDANAQATSVRITAVDLFANVATLRDLLNSGQKPTHLFRTCDAILPVRFLISFGAGDELLAELFPQGDLSLSTPITTLDLSTAAARSLSDARLSFGCSVETVWMGFAPMWKYFSVVR